MTPEPGMGTLNLTVCDREPIRVPGAIQPRPARAGIGLPR
jgi:light-regulated signal transduction histidine kinase (bacteriophytochrome)